MSTLAIEIQVPFAEDVTVTQEALNVDLSDGRTISNFYYIPYQTTYRKKGFAVR